MMVVQVGLSAAMASQETAEVEGGKPEASSSGVVAAERESATTAGAALLGGDRARRVKKRH